MAAQVSMNGSHVSADETISRPLRYSNPAEPNLLASYESTLIIESCVLSLLSLQYGSIDALLADLDAGVEWSGGNRNSDPVVGNLTDSICNQTTAELIDTQIMRNDIEREQAASSGVSRTVEDPGVHEKLRSLLCTLTQQLQGCDEGFHCLRLRLNGALYNSDPSSDAGFEFYLSSRHNWKPQQWTQSTGVGVQNLQSQPLCRPLCQSIHDAELHNDCLVLKHIDILPRAPPSGHSTNIQVEARRRADGSAAPTLRLTDLLDRRPAARKLSFDRSKALTGVQRDKLLMNLAQSLYHFSTDDSTLAHWSRATEFDAALYFLQHGGTEKILSATEVYLTVPLNGERDADYGSDLGCDPQLLVFGKLLLEMYLWEAIEFPQCDKRASPEEFRLDLINRTESAGFRKSETLYNQAILACLNSKPSFGHGGNGRHGRRKEYIIEKIVQPLRDYGDLGKSEKPMRYGGEQSSLSVPVPIYPQTERSSTEGKYSESARDFMKYLRRFTKAHVMPLTEPTRRALPGYRGDDVRIAIIDSGICRQDPDIERYIEDKRIVEVINFSSQNHQDCDDNVGHGTLITKLILQAAPTAKIYIAKVTNSAVLSEESINGICRAINWAVQICKVHIINLSICIGNWHHGIEAALAKAVYPGVQSTLPTIVFAAAGRNDGANSKASWMASCPGVIAVHATDGNGDVHGMNPPMGKNEFYGTLGYDIEMEEYRGVADMPNVYVSGTSYCTPIAAAIAANIIEIVRHRMIDFNGERERTLCSAACMRRIFDKIAPSVGKCRYIQPWTYWDGRVAKGYTDDDIVERLRKIIEQ